MSNFLPLMVRKVLSETGWNDNEMEVYSCLLQNGKLGLTDLSVESGIAISSLQYVVKKLSAKKMISKEIVNGCPVYIANDVDTLEKWIKGYNKRCEQYQDAISAFVDQYDFDPGLKSPKVRFFSGVKGVKSSYKAMLEEMKGKEVVNYFHIIDNEQNELRDFFETEFIPERLNKGISLRSLVVDTEFARHFAKKKSEKRQIKFLHESVQIEQNSEVNVYGDKIHYMQWSNKGALAVVIEDKSMAAMQMNLIESIWCSA